MAKTKGQGSGLAAIGEALDGAQRAGGKVRTQSEVANDEPELPLLPPGCPVTPLGKLAQICFYLDEQRQFIALDPQKHGKTHIRSLFGRKSKLCDLYWPRYGGPNGDVITGWKPEVAADLLMSACAMAGIFDPQGRIRGRGAHLGEHGELIFHCGDTVFISGPEDGYRDPDLIGRFVYPAAPPMPRPWHEAADTRPAAEILKLFGAWYWERPLIDPMLLLGWQGLAMAGGALEWRSHGWITGSKATGKSTLQKAMRTLHDGAALETADASEASLRQLLKQQTLPVFFDEIESEADNSKSKAVIRLARLASSGDTVFRGSADHQAAEFTIRSCFLFSSILMPASLAQDRSRLAILELNEIPADAKEPQLDLAELKEVGRKLRRRLVDHWHRFDQLLTAYSKALSAVGHGGRAQKQFGSLLAMADLLLYDEIDDEVVKFWAHKLRVGTLAETSTDEADEEEAVQFLATSILQGRGGDLPEPVVRWIRTAIADAKSSAAERLENVGLRIVAAKVTTVDGPAGEEPEQKVGAHRPAGEASAELYLAIANRHRELDKIFRETRWGEGVWAQSFRRVKGSLSRVRVRFGPGKPVWSTLIPLSAILDLSPENNDRP